MKQKSVKTLDAVSLGDLFDRRQVIERVYYPIRSAGIPHQRKTSRRCGLAMNALAN
jgi:hypothetical protein